MQSSDGSMPAGHNGPYHDPETPVRNTGHWLITFLKAHEISGDGPLADAARRAAGYLCSPEARPGGATFWHRKTGQDACNGLIGQAWTIEALAEAAAGLQMPELSRLAEEVFLVHPFDDVKGLWERVETDGTLIGIDPTFNHQLWFAAAGALLLPRGEERIGRRVARFLDGLTENLSLYPSGAIVHGMAKVSGPRPKRRLRRAIRGLLPGRPRRPSSEAAYRKSIGYHAFNLYAFALLKRRMPEHPFWESEKLASALRFIGTAEYVQGLEYNEYGYPYNPPGFEVPYALRVLSDQAQVPADAEMSEWVSRQLRRCYDFKANMMSLGTEDPVTHAARIYEATRLPDLPLAIDLGQ